MRKHYAFALLTALLLLLAAAPAAAQSASDSESVLVRVNGDATVAPGEVDSVVVVVDGNLDFQGTAETVVVVSGRADMVGATVETLVVVDGTANLGAGTVVTGDVHLIESDLIRDPTATVEGSIERGTGDFAEGFWILGFLFMVGWAVMTLLAAIVVAAVAPQFARRAGRTITEDLGPTILAGLVLWIVAPILGIILFATFIGLPTALTIWLVVLPAMWLIGFIVAGVRLGEYLTRGTDGVGHPYLAAFVGVLLLIVAGAIPFIGPIIVTIAGFLGSGALALAAFRSTRSQPLVPAQPGPLTDAPQADAPVPDVPVPDAPAVDEAEPQR